MRHRAKGRKFGRKRDQRRAFFKSLATNLILKEKIKTTEARAKEIRSFVERLITQAKKDNLAGRRYLERILSSSVASKLAKEIAPKFKDRSGGYTRIVKIGVRKSDAAPMVIIEFIQ